MSSNKHSPMNFIHQAVMYVIDEKGQNCSKRPLKDDFHPMRIPKDASLLGQAILGSSSGPGQGLLVNTWWGELPDNKGEGNKIHPPVSLCCIYRTAFFISRKVHEHSHRIWLLSCPLYVPLRPVRKEGDVHVSLRKAVMKKNHILHPWHWCRDSLTISIVTQHIVTYNKEAAGPHTIRFTLHTVAIESIHPIIRVEKTFPDCAPLF